jgi:hypothetical protein
MLNSDDMTAIYENLCAHIRESSLPWPGVGHTWTSPIIRFFCRTVPRGNDVWLEVPAGNRRTLDLVWAQSYPSTTNDRLELAVESEQQSWKAAPPAWLEEVKTDVSKVLQANAPAGVLICARERQGETDYVNEAFRELQSVLPPALNKLLLVVMFTPPADARALGCTAHAIIYGPRGIRTPLRAVNCWQD